MVAIRDVASRDWRASIVDLKSDKKKLRLWLMAGGTALVVLIGLIAWLMGGRYVSTDDAYIQADKLMVSSDISGVVLDVKVHEGEVVSKGDVLFRLDPRPFEIAVQSAESELAQSVLDIQSIRHDYQSSISNVAARRADAELARSNYARQEALMKLDATAKATLDQARAALAAANGNLGATQAQAEMQLSKLGGHLSGAPEQLPQYRTAKAKLDEARRQLDHTVVRAPFDGIVTQVSALQPGAMIISSMAAFMPTSAVGLVSTHNVWIQANLKETDLTFVRQGNPVSVTVDAFPGHTYHAHISAIAPGTGATFAMLPTENTGGNWVKVVQRIPVRIAFDPDEDISLLRAGMSTTTEIDTGHSRSFFDLF